jgi:hypothetical protein
VALCFFASVARGAKCLTKPKWNRQASDDDRDLERPKREEKEEDSEKERLSGS